LQSKGSSNYICRPVSDSDIIHRTNISRAASNSRGVNGYRVLGGARKKSEEKGRNEKEAYMSGK